jgi:hypothetical protein
MVSGVADSSRTTMAMVALIRGLIDCSALLRRADFQDPGIGEKTNPKLRDPDDAKETDGDPRHGWDPR